MSNAGFIKIVAEGQYFVTHDAELAKMGSSCRVYTLPRNDQLSKAKGWIRGNEKIGPVLEVTVSNHKGRCGIEFRINSLIDDGSLHGLWS